MRSLETNKEDIKGTNRSCEEEWLHSYTHKNRWNITKTIYLSSGGRSIYQEIGG